MAQLPAPQNLLEALNGQPVPQSQDSVQGGMAPTQGRNGTSLIMHGRVWQVGSGATTTSIPILDSNGLPVLMSASMQVKYTNAVLEIVQAVTVELAVVTAVAANGTLTLDSALSSAPSAGTAFLLTPTQQTSLTGSNAINADVFTATNASTAYQLPNIPCREITIIGLKTNTGQIYVGGSNVSSSHYGALLDAKDSQTFPVANADLLYISVSVAGEGISYVAV